MDLSKVEATQCELWPAKHNHRKTFSQVSSFSPTIYIDTKKGGSLLLRLLLAPAVQEKEHTLDVSRAAA